jgi:hypothetical protein
VHGTAECRGTVLSRVGPTCSLRAKVSPAARVGPTCSLRGQGVPGGARRANLFPTGRGVPGGGRGGDVVSGRHIQSAKTANAHDQKSPERTHTHTRPSRTSRTSRTLLGTCWGRGPRRSLGHRGPWAPAPTWGSRHVLRVLHVLRVPFWVRVGGEVRGGLLAIADPGPQHLPGGAVTYFAYFTYPSGYPEDPRDEVTIVTFF